MVSAGQDTTSYSPVDRAVPAGVSYAQALDLVERFVLVASVAAVMPGGHIPYGWCLTIHRASPENWQKVARALVVDSVEDTMILPVVPDKAFARARERSCYWEVFLADVLAFAYGCGSDKRTGSIRPALVAQSVNRPQAVAKVPAHRL